MQAIAPPVDWEKPSGFCKCGCGNATPIARQTDLGRNVYRGFHVWYCVGHAGSGKQYRWKGGRTKTSNGYIAIHDPSSHLANKHGYVLEHRKVWEEHHRIRLDGKTVHHIDGNRTNNAPENLAALTNAEHAAHHMKERNTPAYRRKQSRAMKKVWAKRKSIHH